jgi:hypothetical protein
MESSSYVYNVISDEPLTPNIMNVIRFDRHQLFTEEMMEFHSQTLRMVEDFYLDNDESWFNSVYNQLCGIWDGYLYTEMLESAKQFGLPVHIIQRIETTINFIKINS